MDSERLEALNASIVAKRAHFADGSPIPMEAEAAVLNEDEKCVYIMQSGVWLMLEDTAILSDECAVVAAAPVNRNSVRAFYDEKGWAEVEEGVYGDTLFEDLRPVAKEYFSNSHRRVNRYLTKGEFFFDIASGPIQYPEHLEYSKGCEYRVCVDFSFRALVAARKRLGTGGIFILGDITNLPIQSATMSGGISLHTIYHVDRSKQLAAFLELYRILKPGAVAVVVYSWGRYCRTMCFIESLSNLPRTLKRLAASMIYGLIRPSKLREIQALEMEEARSDQQLYFAPYPYKWFRENLPSTMEWELKVWRSLSLNVSRRCFPDNQFGRILYKLAYALEEFAPVITARWGQYPMFLIRKGL